MDGVCVRVCGRGGSCNHLVGDPWILGQGPANGMTTVLTYQSVPCSSHDDQKL